MTALVPGGEGDLLRARRSEAAFLLVDEFLSCVDRAAELARELGWDGKRFVPDGPLEVFHPHTATLKATLSTVMEALGWGRTVAILPRIHEDVRDAASVLRVAQARVGRTTPAA